MSARQEDLRGIRDLLIARRAALEQRKRRVEHDLQRRFDPLARDSSDRAIQLENDEVLEVIGDATLDELVAVDETLRRLDLGLYGVCKVCGADVEPGRLEALHAVVCARCAQLLDL